MKKFLAVVLALIMMLTVCGCTLKKENDIQPIEQSQEQNQKQIQEQQADTEEIPDEGKLIEGNVKKPELSSNVTPLVENYYDIIELTGDYEYVFLKKNANSDPFVDVYVENEKGIERELNAGMVPDYMPNFIEEDNTFAVAPNNAIAIVKTMTNTEEIIFGEQGEAYATGYNNTGLPFAAFGDIFKDDRSANENFAAEGLKLTTANEKITKLIVDENIIGMGYLTIAVVNADVTCESNTGAYKTVAWIPDEGETKNADFVIAYMNITDQENKGALHQSIIFDIGVLQ